MNADEVSALMKSFGSVVKKHVSDSVGPLLSRIESLEAKSTAAAMTPEMIEAMLRNEVGIAFSQTPPRDPIIVAVRNMLPEYEIVESEAVRDKKGALVKTITTKQRRDNK
jgi:hypothetical protein